MAIPIDIRMPPILSRRVFVTAIPSPSNFSHYAGMLGKNAIVVRTLPSELQKTLHIVRSTPYQLRNDSFLVGLLTVRLMKSKSQHVEEFPRTQSISKYSGVLCRLPNLISSHAISLRGWTGTKWVSDKSGSNVRDKVSCMFFSYSAVIYYRDT